ncbi:helix-turn-helix domain-containing protein [Halobellus sp. Atlit-38R]|uniref:helix-turn-helix domain-containing protein n=1 Tax=Halobellus sp. Atlit-38R TaxID=2282131 RepID=UPI001314D6BD|nr:helix-turn-helix domain-containing protein [Halobellus sp. Atlit-38R]
MALAHVIRSDPQIGIRVLQEVSTDPVHNMHYFVINTNDIKKFDELVDADHTVEVAERVPSYESQPVYRVEFSPETILLGSVVAQENGFALNAYRHSSGWVERWQLPSRDSLQRIWDFAAEKSFVFEICELHRISDCKSYSGSRLTEKQLELLEAAYANGYFEKPREITLEQLSEQLGISTSAASGRLRRGVKQLIESSDIELALE